jgi:ATP-dependent Clp protease ATP-binding subunit ClpA
MEITSKPTALDEIDRSVLKLEMERLSLTNDTDKASRDRLSKLESELNLLKQRQKELVDQWEHEKSVMSNIQSIKEEVLQEFITLKENHLKQDNFHETYTVPTRIKTRTKKAKEIFLFYTTRSHPHTSDHVWALLCRRKFYVCLSTVLKREIFLLHVFFF